MSQKNSILLIYPTNIVSIFPSDVSLTNTEAFLTKLGFSVNIADYSIVDTEPVPEAPDLIIASFENSQEMGLELFIWLKENYSDSQLIIPTDFYSFDTKWQANKHINLKYVNNNFKNEELKNLFDSSIYYHEENSISKTKIFEFIQIALITKKKTLISLKAEKSDKQGLIYINNGEISHIKYDTNKGVKAFYEIVSENTSNFSEVKWEEPTEKSISVSIDMLILQAIKNNGNKYRESEQKPLLNEPEENKEELLNKLNKAEEIKNEIFNKLKQAKDYREELIGKMDKLESFIDEWTTKQNKADELIESVNIKLNSLNRKAKQQEEIDKAQAIEDAKTVRPEIKTERAEVKTVRPEVKTVNPDIKSESSKANKVESVSKQRRPDVKKVRPDAKIVMPEIKAVKPEAGLGKSESKTSVKPSKGGSSNKLNLNLKLKEFAEQQLKEVKEKEDDYLPEMKYEEISIENVDESYNSDSSREEMERELALYKGPSMGSPIAVEPETKSEPDIKDSIESEKKPEEMTEEEIEKELEFLESQEKQDEIEDEPEKTEDFYSDTSIKIPVQTLELIKQKYKEELISVDKHLIKVFEKNNSLP